MYICAVEIFANKFVHKSVELYNRFTLGPHLHSSGLAESSGEWMQEANKSQSISIFGQSLEFPTIHPRDSWAAINGQVAHDIIQWPLILPCCNRATSLLIVTLKTIAWVTCTVMKTQKVYLPLPMYNVFVTLGRYKVHVRTLHVDMYNQVVDTCAVSWYAHVAMAVTCTNMNTTLLVFTNILTVTSSLIVTYTLNN